MEKQRPFPDIKLNKKFWNTAYANAYTLYDVYDRLKLYAINMFEWINLPDSIDERYLELMLFEKGHLCFFYEPRLDSYLALTCTLQGPFNVYNQPTVYNIYTSTPYHAVRRISTSVLIWNNYLHTPTHQTIWLFAQRIANIDRTIDINVMAQKTPVLVIANQNTQTSLKNLYAKWDSHEPVIYGSPEINLDSLRVLKTDAPYISDKLTILKNAIWNEAMTFLGLDNANTDKKERLITDEVNSNNGQIEQSRLNMLNSRKNACKKINKMFGLNIDVKFRSHIDVIDTKLIEYKNEFDLEDDKFG